MTEAAVLLALRAALLASSGLAGGALLGARQDIPRRDIPHAVLRRVVNVGVGRAFREGEGWAQHRRLTAQVTTVGEAAGVALLDSHALLMVDVPEHQALRDAGVGVTEVSQIRDLTRLGRTQQEPRSAFDVTLSYVHTVTAGRPTPADRIRLEAQACGIDDEPVEVLDDLADQRPIAFLHLLLPSSPVLS